MIDFAHLVQAVSGTVLRGTFNIPNQKKFRFYLHTFILTLS